MSIDDILERATDEQRDIAIRESPFKKLAEEGWEIYLGSPLFGKNRNQFWYNPSDGGLVVDYVNNMVHIVGNQLSSLKMAENQPESIEDKQNRDRIIMNSLGQLNHYLAENLRMYQSKNEGSESALGIPNRVIFDDINELRRRAHGLTSMAIGTPKFVDAVKEFIDFYRAEIMQRYAPHLRSPNKIN
ncbi:hypothetical protein J4234_03995 [Candidatus Woesearchaeota archaeon]|nr:hypothetical protein [Candidatus Woesearchaeota archaeon]